MITADEDEMLTFRLDDNRVSTPGEADVKPHPENGESDPFLEKAG